MSAAAGTLLLVEDDDDLRFAVARFLRRAGFEVVEAAGVADAADRFLDRRPEVAIVDYGLPDGDGLRLLRLLRRHDPELGAIVLTGHATIELAVESIKEGADQFLTKPVELEALRLMVARLAESRQEHRAQRASRRRRWRGEIDPFAGDSPAIARLRADAARVAGAALPVLIEGETGSGKGVLARWLHANGPRRDEAWVDLNCAGLSRPLLESELFGHEKGAFTGAVAAKPGLLEVADRGTLFLDEIGDLSLEIQPRLLKVLEEKTFRRLGEVRERRVDVRLVAATHHDLAARARAGEFRTDLLFRIDAVRLVMPPLRERGGDVLRLARDLLGRLGPGLGHPEVVLEPAAERALAAHDWPGNVRELRNVVERLLLFGRGGAISAEAVERAIGNGRPGAANGAEPGGGEPQSLAEAEKHHIRATLRRLSGDVRAAARVLRISRSGLYKKLQRHGIVPSELQTG